MPSPVADLIGDLAAALDGLDVDWYLFGAQAAILHGAARLTADVDVTVLLPAARSTDSLIETAQRHGFEPRFGDSRFLARTRVIPLAHTRTGIPVDIVLGGPGLEETFMARAKRRHVEGTDVPVASAEDLGHCFCVRRSAFGVRGAFLPATAAASRGCSTRLPT